MGVGSTRIAVEQLWDEPLERRGDALAVGTRVRVV